MKDLLIEMEEAEHFGETDVGCDIHWIIEKYSTKLDKWVGVAGSDEVYNFTRDRYPYDPLRSRNYEWFASLAGVRGSGPAPRGLPKNASDFAIAMTDDWYLDSHSHSWMMLDDFISSWIEYNCEPHLAGEAAASKLAGERGWLDIIFPQLWIDANELKSYRVIFYFDN